MSELKQIAGPNDVKIYNLSTGKTLPEWLKEKSYRSLKKDEEFTKRVELIQDLEFPTACNRIKMSADGQYLVASGTYPPQVRVFELSELSMKFDRRLDSDIVQFQVLSDDWKKLVFLRADRTIELHAQYGRHHLLRVPRFCRDMAYYAGTCDLFVVGDASEIYRLNLDQGRFLEPFETSMSDINVCGMNKGLRCLGVGGADGIVELWDPRQRKRAPMLNVSKSVMVGGSSSSVDVTALRFKDSDPLSMAVGTSSGQVLMYDLRSDKPLLIKDHQYNFPIVDIQYLEQTKHVMSADCKSIKIWNQNDGKIFTAVEPKANVNDVCIVKDSGLIFAGCETDKVQSFFIPELGRAPKWCYYLENLTESLAETRDTTIYDKYRFVTKEELADLGLSHLIGTDHLREHLHGFFMDKQLWADARIESEPFAYEEYRKKKIKEKIEAKRKNRITIRRKLPKINKELAKQLMTGSGSSAKKRKGDNFNVLEDNRFSDMFANPDFQIDKESEEYRFVNPNQKTTRNTNVDSDEEQAEEEEEAFYDQFELLEETNRRTGGGYEDSSSDEEDGYDDSDSDQDLRYGIQRGRGKERGGNKGKERAASKERGPRMFALKEGTANPLKRKNREKMVEQRKKAKVSLETRLAEAEAKQAERERLREERVKGKRGTKIFSGGAKKEEREERNGNRNRRDGRRKFNGRNVGLRR